MRWILLLAAALALAGCKDLDCVLVNSLKASDAVILTEYSTYVMRDPTLSPQEKADILAHVERRRDLMEIAGRDCDEN